MGKTKAVKLVYVEAFPEVGVPAHVKVQYNPYGDDRLHTTLLTLPDEEVARIAQLPDAPVWQNELPTPAQVNTHEYWWYLQNETPDVIELFIEEDMVCWRDGLNAEPLTTDQWPGKWMPCHMPPL